VPPAPLLDEELELDAELELELAVDEEADADPPVPELCDGFAELPHPPARTARTGAVKATSGRRVRMFRPQQSPSQRFDASPLNDSCGAGADRSSIDGGARHR
jgi:hypothetical protein